MSLQQRASGRVQPATLVDELRQAADNAGDLPYLIDEKQTITYATHWARVRSFAAGLVQQGVLPGDHVAVWAANDIAAATAMHAVLAAGAVIVPLNTRLTLHEVKQILDRSGAAMVLAPDEFLGRRYVEEVRSLSAGVTIVSLGQAGIEEVSTWLELIDGSTIEALAEVDRRIGAADGDSVIVVQFTSGTTGEPKGVCLRQGPLLVTAREWSSIVGLTSTDVTPILYPLSHVGGLKTGLTSSLAVRAAVVLIPVVTVDAVIEVLQRHPISVMNGPPAVLQGLLDEVGAGRLQRPAHLRTVVTGSSIVPPQLVLDLKTQLGVTDVINAYGLTEATGVCSMSRRGDDVERVCRTLGQPISGVEFRVLEPDGDGVGEFEIRSPAIMAGYLDDQVATAEMVRDGWLRTGDTGWIDDDGYIHLAGRSSDLILVGGYNVYPAEVENALVQHPSVVEAAVVGRTDERLGEVPVAFVVVDAPLEEGELDAWMTTRLANYKRPRDYWRVDELPRGELGKVAAKTLRARAEADPVLPQIRLS